jgi:hypothetical protein
MRPSSTTIGPAATADGAAAAGAVVAALALRRSTLRTRATSSRGENGLAM